MCFQLKAKHALFVFTCTVHTSCTRIPSDVVNDISMLCFLGSRLCIPAQSYCVTAWCNPSVNASSQRRMSKTEWWWKLCQWFTWLLCRFTSCTSPHIHVLRCFTKWASGGLCIFLAFCVHIYMCVRGGSSQFYFYFIWLHAAWIIVSSFLLIAARVSVPRPLKLLKPYIEAVCFLCPWTQLVCSTGVCCVD